MAKRGRAVQDEPRTLTTVELILSELDRGYLEAARDRYPPFALLAWEDRNRYRQYVERVLTRLAHEGKL